MVTASTGASACLIGGVTLHSFAGIGIGECTIERGIEMASKPQVAQIWRRCKTLIIDEISMVDGEYFEVCTNLMLLFFFFVFHGFIFNF
jgi:ATP-dependent DNA helicase PIF1